ncbi:MAG: hypothetical protein JWN38_903 [Candidatus Saccharibacteria bacterium]|nr:hypothetical protein [Candidatus Saccharibacteria bacterium]
MIGFMVTGIYLMMASITYVVMMVAGIYLYWPHLKAALNANDASFSDLWQHARRNLLFLGFMVALLVASILWPVTYPVGFWWFYRYRWLPTHRPVHQ